MEILASLLLRPHRSVYDPSKALGPSEFSIRGHVCRRVDIEVSVTQLLNPQGLKLQCSWFKPPSSRTRALPCVVYCHGNCGNRLDALDILEYVLMLGMSVFAFDFSGSGVSDGCQVTLGHREKLDLSTVVQFLKGQHGVGPIALWGRSMGAAAALLFAATSRDVSALILDSPFATLKQASQELIGRYRVIPNALGDIILKSIRKHVERLAGFDMFGVSPIDEVQLIDIPALFVHSRDDQLVNISHSESLFEAYPHPDKTFIKLSGGHNSTRPMALYFEVASFLKRCLKKKLVDRLGETKKAGLPFMDDDLRERIKQDLRA